MKKPNFFIIGAPKCGTTSMCSWLAEHPSIYFSPRKEPGFFSFDYGANRISSLEEYEKLFIEAKNEHTAIGEGSTVYLYSRHAVPAIIAYSPFAKFIVSIRNPIEMAHSLFSQRIFEQMEHVTNFAEAWELQEKRMYGGCVSKWCKDPQQLLYGPLCQVGRQLKRLYSIVSSNRVLVLFLEDMKQNPRKEYLKVLNFLGLNDDGRTQFPVMNPAKEKRSMTVSRRVRTIGKAKRLLAIKKSFGLLKAIERKNTRFHSRKPLSEEVRRALQNYFQEDIVLLSNLLDRDLSHWIAE